MRFSQLGRVVALSVFACIFFVLIAPGCGRTSLEPETLREGGTTQACGPSTCPNGCCDASGICRTGGDTRACGSNGSRCSDCVSQGFAICTERRVCGRDDPACSSATCPGCCSLDGGRQRCLSGTEPSACGRSGLACADCSVEGRACDAGTRACGAGKCDATNCNGCCVGDKCLAGSDVLSCGAAGEQCTSCAAGQVCRGQSGGGGKCEGTPSCGPQNCGGCCTAAGQCVAGSDSTACGKGGSVCSSCGANEFCVPDGQPGERTCQALPSCGPENCDGCCAGNNCVVNVTPGACGKDGQACKACGPNEACSAGVCQPAGGCNAQSCAGCCIGDICAVGTQNTACGLGGGACENCSGQAPPRVCQGGACELPSCGPGNCLGCCVGNTCVVGTQDNACGSANGQACADCTQTNQVCQAGQCVDKCGPGNCTGCCGATGCAGGVANNACGSGGVACDNCTTQASFCNGLVTPRRCNNKQTTCPAPYTTCPAAITMPVTPTLQKHCTDAVLANLATACAASPDAPQCVSAIQVLVATSPACATCIQPFAKPFTEGSGLWRCAAPFVPATCRRETGCAADCADDSCTQCVPASEAQCRDLVNGPGGQCRTFALASGCANAALAAGQLCSQFSYPDYGQWLRAVGDHYCGNGP